MAVVCSIVSVMGLIFFPLGSRSVNIGAFVISLMLSIIFAFLYRHRKEQC